MKKMKIMVVSISIYISHFNRLLISCALHTKRHQQYAMHVRGRIAETWNATFLFSIYNPGDQKKWAWFLYNFVLKPFKSVRFIFQTWPHLKQSVMFRVSNIKHGPINILGSPGSPSCDCGQELLLFYVQGGGQRP